MAPNAGRGLPNGLAYAFQSKLLPGEQCLVVRCLNGVPVVEVPLRGGSTLFDVCLFLETTTDLTSGTLSLPLAMSELST